MTPRARLQSWWQEKLGWSLLLNGLFFTDYALVQRHHLGEPFTMPLIPGETSIPFIPAAVWPYLSLALFMPLLPWLLVGRAALRRYFIVLTVLGSIGLIFFALVPTRIERPMASVDAPSVLLWLQQIDRDGNACPSLHAAFSLFTAVGLHAVDRSLRLLAWMWCIIILAGILLVKQHGLIDVITGAILGGAAGWAWIRWTAGKLR